MDKGQKTASENLKIAAASAIIIKERAKKRKLHQLHVEEEKRKKKIQKLTDKTTASSSEEEDNEKPAQKTHKSKKTILYDPGSQLPHLREIFKVSPICVHGISGVKSNLTGTDHYNNIYPIWLGPPNVENSPKLLGVSKPSYVFTGLENVFTRLENVIPGSNIANWEIYKWNLKAYGNKMAKSCEPYVKIMERVARTRPFGGTENPPHINELEEFKVKRYSKSIHVKHCDVFDNIRDSLTFLNEDHLKCISELVNQKDSMDEEIENKIKNLVTSEDFKKKLTEAQGEDSEEDDNTSEED
jgi:hypothetical protein